MVSFFSDGKINVTHTAVFFIYVVKFIVKSAQVHDTTQYIVDHNLL